MVNTTIIVQYQNMHTLLTSFEVHNHVLAVFGSVQGIKLESFQNHRNNFYCSVCNCNVYVLVLTTTSTTTTTTTNLTITITTTTTTTANYHYYYYYCYYYYYYYC